MAVFLLFNFILKNFKKIYSIVLCETMQENPDLVGVRPTNLHLPRIPILVFLLNTFMKNYLLHLFSFIGKIKNRPYQTFCKNIVDNFTINT
jgi:hypothetical protein